MASMEYEAAKLWVEPELKLNKATCRFMAKYADILCQNCFNLNNLMYDKNGEIIQLICGVCICKINQTTICPGVGGKCYSPKTPANLFVNCIGDISKVCKSCAKARQYHTNNNKPKIVINPSKGMYVNPNPGLIDATWPTL